MDIFSKLPEKDRRRICYGFIAMTAGLIIFFSWASLSASDLKASVYITCILALILILAWTLKGGTLKGSFSPVNGLHGELSDGTYGESTEVPETDVRGLIIRKKQGDIFD